MNIGEVSPFFLLHCEASFFFRLGGRKEGNAYVFGLVFRSAWRRSTRET